MYSLDRIRCKDGDNLIYKMPYWGNIIYTRRTFKNEVYVVVKDFQFNTKNFYNWINHRFGNNTTNNTPNRPLQNTFPNGYNKPQIRGYNGLYIAQNTKSGLYTIIDKKGIISLNGYFNAIQWYRRNNFNIIAIGVKNNIRYNIYKNGAVEQQIKNQH